MKNIKKKYINSPLFWFQFFILLTIAILAYLKYYSKPIPSTLYVPVSNMVLFPTLSYSLELVKNEKSRIFVASMKQAYSLQKSLLIVLKNNDESLEKIGTLCSIGQLTETATKIQAQVSAIKLVKINKIDSSNPSLSLVETKEFKINTDKIQENNDLIYSIRRLINSQDHLKKWFGDKALDIINNSSDYYKISNIISHIPEMEIKHELAILKQHSLTKRLEYNLFYLKKFTPSLQNKSQAKIEDQKPHIVQESEKFNNHHIDMNNLDEVNKILLSLPLPKDIKTKAMEEFEKLKSLPAGHHEKSISQKYLEYIIKLPWHPPIKSENSSATIQKASEELSASHYGMEEIKERIVEYLAVMNRLKNKKSPIICFTGPPGVGKTSIAKAIASATNRKFVKMALGGVRDEAVIRGHLRSYIGSMPGMVIQKMVQAQSTNPVFLLDEIDKIESQSNHGDPAAALLEVLDPEQNSSFSDNYLGFGYDLSHVLFIATANNIEKIPRALRDRLEIIELNSYSINEKVEIAQKYILPKLIKNFQIQPTQLLNNKQLATIIHGYTFESGVRDLERILEKLLRKELTSILKTDLENKDSTIIKIEPFSDEAIIKLLGPELISDSILANYSRPGQVNGLVVTGIGGQVMPIEAITLKGHGKVEQTGRLGDMMKESISVAKSIVWSHEGQYGLEKNLSQKYDLHIHMPEAAIQKDGPSAGITLVTAMVSAYSNRPVRSDLAMTGEVSLNGNVLAIGGVKEKLIAAHRRGIKTVIIPLANKKNLHTLPKEVLNEMNIIYASTIDDVLKVAFKK